MQSTSTHANHICVHVHACVFEGGGWYNVYLFLYFLYFCTHDVCKNKRSLFQLLAANPSWIACPIHVAHSADYPHATCTAKQEATNNSYHLKMDPVHLGLPVRSIKFFQF